MPAWGAAGGVAFVRRDNTLGLQFIGHYTRDCEDTGKFSAVGASENNTNIELSGSLLPLSDDLKILPLPFYDNELERRVSDCPLCVCRRPNRN